jgi:SAM-dependent methyltransferase
VTIPNEAQREAWNGASGLNWVADPDHRDAVLAEAADRLLAVARLAPGEDVLDIGCGCGVTSIAAAAMVRPGSVTGIDLSAPMLEVARRRTGDAGVTYVQADAQTHAFEPAAFDVAITRFGTMFFDDPIGAFTNIAGAVRDGGRLCLATWQPLSANDWLTVPGAALVQFGPLPGTDGSGPGMFAQSDPTRVTDVLERAGWSDVDVEPTTVSLKLGDSVAEATDYLAATGIGRSVLDPLDDADRRRALAAVSESLEPHAGVDGVRLDGAINLVTASIRRSS